MILIEFIDNVPTYKGKKTITYEDGTQQTVIIENAEEPSVNGTPINRTNMMAIQGFVSQETRFDDDGSIIETNSKGETKTIRFNSDGTITETFIGEKEITKTTSFEGGNIKEVIS